MNFINFRNCSDEQPEKDELQKVVTKLATVTVVLSLNVFLSFRIIACRCQYLSTFYSINAVVDFWNQSTTVQLVFLNEILYALNRPDRCYAVWCTYLSSLYLSLFKIVNEGSCLILNIAVIHLLHVTVWMRFAYYIVYGIPTKVNIDTALRLCTHMFVHARTCLCMHVHVCAHMHMFVHACACL